jgi:hypothetical protein
MSPAPPTFTPTFCLTGVECFSAKGATLTISLGQRPR